MSISDHHRIAEWESRLSDAGWPDADPRSLRRYGIYSQRPVKDGYFMIRIRVPNGELTSTQLNTVGDISNHYGRSIADVTVRQNIQLHWVDSCNLPDVLARVSSVGLGTTEPCASLRNVVTCAVSGVDEDELFDTSRLVRELNAAFASTSEFETLPRKLKMTVTGCAVRCVYPEVQDIAVFAAPDKERGGVGFRVRVGGGLSTRPRFSRDLGVMISAEEVVELTRALAVVFRDRSNNGQATRVSYSVEESELPIIRAQVEKQLGREFRLTRDTESPPVAERDRSHVGIHGQNVSGLYYIGLSLLGGRTSGDALKRLANFAERYASGRVRATNGQNIVLIDVPEWNLEPLTDGLNSAGFEYEPNWSRKAMIACSGTQFCNMALTETKNRAEEVADYLDGVLDLDEPVRISVTGCPNSCGQHQICDVGLEGSLVTIDGERREAFHLLLGGGVGRLETFSRRLAVQIPAEQLAGTLARLFAVYKATRIAAETFQEYCQRHSDDELVALLKAPLTSAHYPVEGSASLLNLSPSQSDGLARLPNSLSVPSAQAVECPVPM